VRKFQNRHIQVAQLVEQRTENPCVSSSILLLDKRTLKNFYLRRRAKIKVVAIFAHSTLVFNQKYFYSYRFLFFLRQLFPKTWLNFFVLSGTSPELCATAQPRLLLFFRVLHQQWYTRFRTLAELTAVDYPSQGARFRLAYSLLSYTYTGRLAIFFGINERTVVPSLTPLFSGAAWQEREVWDLFGIFFQGNQDLRRILTDYGFAGHPLRKDFPLTGFSEILYDDRKKQIIYRPVSLAQEFRNFTSVNPWVLLFPNTSR
jgi:NADH:ubiquinone oxidoreductase subunit C